MAAHVRRRPRAGRTAVRATAVAAMLATAALWGPTPAVDWAGAPIAPPLGIAPRHGRLAGLEGLAPRRQELAARRGGVAALDGAQPEMPRHRDSLLALSHWLRNRRPIPVALGTFAGILAFGEKAALATATAGKPHVGQRVAMAIQSHIALPDWATLMLLSSLPLVELRGGIPVGLWMGMPVAKVLLLCIIGNMIPIPIILFALQSPTVKKLLRPVLSRAEKKTSAIGAHDRWVGIAAFVGVPLPGTGAWTGAMVAYLLGMELREAVTSIFTGVCVAAAIMASLTLAGWYGCAAAVCLCLVALGSRYLPFNKQ